ncbi:hypothetical protein K470DRAFT_268004 [Piedraia hortae CBS 480.64]|uniref:Uncharacterized protein n=1 Tax=Piedraia hortae CBS 480.64 TaxID=1314780 RepID=A0A6A7C8L5_9PEZI|nr:hypothetical protein K470DRAFT_268004 [Piedraia hortae CBS 480.64]
MRQGTLVDNINSSLAAPPSLNAQFNKLQAQLEEEKDARQAELLKTKTEREAHEKQIQALRTQIEEAKRAKEATLRENGGLHERLGSLVGEVKLLKARLDDLHHDYESTNGEILTELPHLAGDIAFVAKQWNSWERDLKAKHSQALMNLRSSLEEQMSSLKQQFTVAMDTKVQELELKRKAELAELKSRMEKEHVEEINAIRAEKDTGFGHHISYNTYRLLFADLKRGIKSLVASLELLVETRTSSISTSPSLVQKLPPSFSQRYPDLVGQLQPLEDAALGVEEHPAANRIKVKAQMLSNISKELSSAAHWSRQLTRYQHMTLPSPIAAADIFSWVANERPFIQLRDQLTRKIETSQDRSPSTSGANKLRLNKERHQIHDSIAILARIIDIHRAVRGREALATYWQSTTPEKIKAATVAKIARQTTDLFGEWDKLISASRRTLTPQAKHRQDLDVDRAVFDKLRELHEGQDRLEDIVLKRATLEDMLGVITPQQIQDADKVIVEEMILWKQRERARLAALVERIQRPTVRLIRPR